MEHTSLPETGWQQDGFERRRPEYRGRSNIWATSHCDGTLDWEKPDQSQLVCRWTWAAHYQRPKVQPRPSALRLSPLKEVSESGRTEL